MKTGRCKWCNRPVKIFAYGKTKNDPKLEMCSSCRQTRTHTMRRYLERERIEKLVLGSMTAFGAGLRKEPEKP